MSSIYSGIDSASAFSSVSSSTKFTSLSQASVAIKVPSQGNGLLSDTECEDYHIKAKSSVAALLQSSSESTYGDIDWFKTERFATQSSIEFGKILDSGSEKHKILAKVTSKIPATVDEIMAILICDTSGRIASSLTQLDGTVNSGEVLQTLYPREHEYIHPNVPLCNLKRVYRNLRKREKDKPKLREMVYLDYLTIRTEEDGSRIGVQVMESIDLPNLPPSGARFHVPNSSQDQHVGKLPNFTSNSKQQRVAFLERSGIVVRPGLGNWSDVTMVLRINPGLQKWDELTSHKAVTMSYLRQLGKSIENLSTYVYNCKAKFGSVSGAFGCDEGTLIHCGWNPGHIDAFTVSQKADAVLGRKSINQTAFVRRFDPSRITNKSWLLSMEESSVSTAGGLSTELYAKARADNAAAAKKALEDGNSAVGLGTSSSSLLNSSQVDSPRDEEVLVQSKSAEEERLRKLELAVRAAEAKALEAERKAQEKDERMRRLEEKLKQFELANEKSRLEQEASMQLVEGLGSVPLSKSQTLNKEMQSVEEYLEAQFNGSVPLTSEEQPSTKQQEGDMNGVQAFLEAQFNRSASLTSEEQRSSKQPEGVMNGVEAFLDAQFNGSESKKEEAVESSKDDMNDVEAFLEAQFNGSVPVTSQEQPSTKQPEGNMNGVEAFLEAQFNGSDSKKEEAVESSKDDMNGVEAFLEAQFNGSDSKKEEAVESSKDDMNGVEAFLEAQFNGPDSKKEEAVESSKDDMNGVEAFLESQFRDSANQIQKPEVAVVINETEAAPGICKGQNLLPDHRKKSFQEPKAQMFDNDNMSEVEAFLEAQFNGVQSA